MMVAMLFALMSWEQSTLKGYDVDSTVRVVVVPSIVGQSSGRASVIVGGAAEEEEGDELLAGLVVAAALDGPLVPGFSNSFISSTAGAVPADAHVLFCSSRVLHRNTSTNSPAYGSYYNDNNQDYREPESRSSQAADSTPFGGCTRADVVGSFLLRSRGERSDDLRSSIVRRMWRRDLKSRLENGRLFANPRHRAGHLWAERLDVWAIEANPELLRYTDKAEGKREGKGDNPGAMDQLFWPGAAKSVVLLGWTKESGADFSAAKGHHPHPCLRISFPRMNRAPTFQPQKVKK